MIKPNKSTLLTQDNPQLKRSRIKSMNEDIEAVNNSSVRCEDYYMKTKRCEVSDRLDTEEMVQGIVQIEDKAIGSINMRVMIKYLSVVGYCRLLLVAVCKLHLSSLDIMVLRVLSIDSISAVLERLGLR